MPLHASGRQVPWMEGFPKFPLSAAVHQAGWQGQLAAAWKPSSKETLLRPQKPVQKLKLAQKTSHLQSIPASEKVYVAKCHGAFHADSLQTRVIGGLGNDLAINLGRKPLQSHLKLNVKITPMRHFDIINIL